MKLKYIKNYEKSYKIREDGELFSITRNKYLKLNSVSNNGYKRIGLYKDGKVKYYSIHRLVAEAFLENKLEQVNHIDGNKLNNHYLNLEWITASKNCLHRSSILKKVTGSNHGMSKLTDIEIKEIRKLFKKGINRKFIAKKYNISERNVYHIGKEDTWRYLSN